MLFDPFAPSDKILLALSGGPDSIYLGEMLFRTKFQNVVVAHFEHGIRGKESIIDQKFCSQIAKKWGWKFETENWKDTKKSEEKARIARYEFLEKIRKKYSAEAIFLAHHLDDQVETIFFQFLRGTGIRGLMGMKKWDEERKLFRPLLEISKSEILKFLKKENLVFREDSSNFDPDAFDRNYLRLEVLPLLQKRFPHFQRSILRNAELFRKMDEGIQEQVENVMKYILNAHEGATAPSRLPNCGEIQFDRKCFFVLPEFLRGEIFRKFFAPKSPSYEQIQELDEFLKTAKSGKEKSLLGVKFQVFGENVFVVKSLT
ncbi:tRNA lysidine(34) synthetase TilS [Candidatus Peregrinibacteria bacterium]|nr:tRNA lysidine(34) synthetase TilS [Candidatus Peregrinibacteria bacterium]